MVPEVGATEREKSAAMLEPAPVRLTVCGLPEVLSVARRLPVRVPDAVGENVTLMAQFPPTANEPPQLSVSAKSPLATMLLMARVAVPVFVSVTVGAALVPVRPTVCGLPEALSVTLELPVRVPDAVGVNVTLMLQFPPDASEPPQLSVSAKSPLATMLLMVRVAVPVFDSVTVCAALVVPTLWLAKVSEVGERLATGAGPEGPKNSVISGAVAAPPNPLKLTPNSSAMTLKVLS